MHWAALRRINALDSHLRRVLGIPIHCGRDVLYFRYFASDRAHMGL
jgi:hypothetical protein